MITYEFDPISLGKVEKKLGNLKSQAPKALKNAINMTARKTRTELKNTVKKEYTVKARDLSSGMTLSSASVGNLEATIYIRGKPLHITHFKATTPKSGAKTQIVKSGALKAIVGPRKIKAFRGVNGLIWQRVGRERFPIKPLSSNSVPVMVRNDKVYGKVEPTIKRTLKENVDKQVRKILEA